VRRTVVAGAIAAGTAAVALAVGGVAYANAAGDARDGEQIVRVVTEDGGRDCPDKNGRGTAPGGEAPGQAPGDDPEASVEAPEAGL
jgi:hypothetical protein